MTLAELNQNIETFRRRVNDPELSEAQRAVFKQALEGALKKREALFGNQPENAEQPVAKKPAKPKVEEGSRPNVVLTAPADDTEKKTLVWKSAPTVGINSPATPEAEIVVECDLGAVSQTVMIFRWGGGKREERLTPGLTMCRFKARVDDVARLERKRPGESRCFHRAVAYYAGLMQFCGRELNPTDFGFRGRKARVLEKIQEAYRAQGA
ncbi:MAG: hypothetical protein R3D58_06930 [Saprospiraceae bacterium]|nr:hypothetical protein [Lewinellaceae bacterium]